MTEAVIQQQVTGEQLRKIQTDNLAQFLLDNTKILEEIYHKLRGETLTEEERIINGQPVLVPVWKNIFNIKPIANDLGLSKVMYFLQMAMTANNATGSVDKETAITLAFKEYYNLMKNLYENKEEYGFKSDSNINLLSGLVHTNLTMHFSKSADMSLLRELFTSVNISEIRGVKGNNQPEPTVQI